ncbi:hypothetical protein D3C87_1704190 [compost metagenome]
MIGYINKGRVKLDQVIDSIIDGLHIVSLQRRQYLEREQRITLCVPDVFRYFHNLV